MDNPVYIGIDIGKFQLSCSAPGRQVKDFANNSDGIRDMLGFCTGVATPQRLFFVMEATGGYSTFTAETILELADLRVAIVPPACVSGFINSRIRRTKNDRADALAIRRFGETMQPAPWLPPAQILQQLRQLRLVLDGLGKTIIRCKCLMEKLKGVHQTCELALTTQQRLLDHAIEQRRLLESEIEKLIQSDPALARDSALILSIDGVGPATRTMIMALCYSQLRNLPQRKLLTHCGLSPQENQSGKLRGLTRMNKQGDSRIRQLLYMVAVRMVCKDGIMHEYFKRHKEQLHKPGKVALVSVMRKVLYLIQAVVKSGEPFDRARYLKLT